MVPPTSLSVTMRDSTKALVFARAARTARFRAAWVKVVPLTSSQRARATVVP